LLECWKVLVGGLLILHVHLAPCCSPKGWDMALAWLMSLWRANYGNHFICFHDCRNLNTSTNNV
jgi:hypothetical protein